MIQLKTALILVVIHVVYYFVLQVISDFMRIGIVKNTPNKEISRLRTKHHVNIKTFQKNNQHFGFAWFKTVYLNENLFKRPKALLFTFYHELYHVEHKHKRNTLLLRALFSFIPVILALHWIPFVVIYISFAYYLYLTNERYEKNANAFASEKLQNN